MISAADLDVSTLPVVQDLQPTDTVILVRLNQVYAVSGDTLRNRTRPILRDAYADQMLDPSSPGLKIDPDGGTVTITLPALTAAATQEYPFVHLGDPAASVPGSIVFQPQLGELILIPKGLVPSFTLTRPGETVALRAEAIQKPGKAPRRYWLLTRV